MEIYCLILFFISLILGSEAVCWTVTILRHLTWIKKNPETELGLAINRRSLFFGGILSGIFCSLVWVYFIYCMSLMIMENSVHQFHHILGLSFAPGVFLTHIHMWSMVARYLCLHTKYWPYLSNKVYKLLNKFSKKKDIALYCLLFERWREIVPISETHRGLFHSFFDIVPEMIWSQDTLGRITYGNKATFKMFGGSKNTRLLGGTLREIVQTKNLDYVNSTFLNMNDKSDFWVLANQRIYKGVIYGDMNGKFYALYITKSPIYEIDNNKNKAVTGIICLAHDITIEWEEHNLVSYHFSNRDYKRARRAFEAHKDRFEGKPLVNTWVNGGNK